MMLVEAKASSENHFVKVYVYPIEIVSEVDPVVSIRSIEIDEDNYAPRKRVFVRLTIDDTDYTLQFTLYDETFNLNTDTGQEKDRVPFDPSIYVEARP